MAVNWSFYQEILGLFWLCVSLDDAVIVLKAYVVATTSTLLSKQKALLWQEILEVYIKIYFLMSILIQYKIAQ